MKTQKKGISPGQTDSMTMPCVQGIKTAIRGNQPLCFYQMILLKVIRPQEGVSRSQGGFPTTIVVGIGQNMPKITPISSFSALTGVLLAVTLVFSPSIFIKRS